MRLDCNYHAFASRGLSLFLNFFAGVNRLRGSDLWNDPAQNMKGRSLGDDRPSLGARLGVGLSKPWGVWEAGFDERLGGPPAGYGDSVGRGALGSRALPNPYSKGLSHMICR